MSSAREKEDEGRPGKNQMEPLPPAGPDQDQGPEGAGDRRQEQGAERSVNWGR